MVADNFVGFQNLVLASSVHCNYWLYLIDIALVEKVANHKEDG